LAIAQALGVEPLWLMTGEGEMGAHATPVEAPLVEDDDAETHAFLERLRSAVTQSGKTKLAIERDARVARGQLSHMLAARRPNVSAVVVVRLADAIGADVTWLLTGRGAVRPEAHRNLAHACALFVEDGQNNGRDGDLVRLAIAQVESNSDHPHDDLPIRGWFSMLEEAYVDACVQRRLAEELERLARRLGAKP
jgi:transcriptional regulator with XRE-family HTH domain